MRVFSLLLLLAPAAAGAFPDMIRHGYTSCTACHVSPGGGGLLNAYGRTIAGELLSRWSYPGEEQIFHGLIGDEKLRGWLDGSRDRGFNIGGDLRFLQTRTETKAFRQGRFVPMQRDIEVAARFDSISLVGSYGLTYDPAGPDRPELRRAYALLNVGEAVSIRLGRFTPIFGIMLSDHYLAVKRDQRLGLGSERDTIEGQYTGETWSAHLSLSHAPRTKTALAGEDALSAGFNLNIGERARVGLNYWIGEYSGGRRDITGVHALWGVSPRIYSLSEVDLQVEAPDQSGKTKGVRYFERFGLEVTRGLHLLAQIEGSQSDLRQNSTRYYAPGIGANFYPRTHFELQLMWTRPKYENREFTDAAFFVFHYFI